MLQRLNLFYLLILFALCSCNERKPWAEVRQLMSLYQRADARQYVHDLFYENGPAGWMLEKYIPDHDYLSTYVFCPDGFCNLAEEEKEYTGNWKRDGDSIRIFFFGEINTVFTGKKNPQPMHQETGSQREPLYNEFREEYEQISFNRVLCWGDIVNSVVSADPYPFKLISRDAVCE